MRKKKLLEENIILAKQLAAAKLKIERLKAELEKAKASALPEAEAAVEAEVKAEVKAVEPAEKEPEKPVSEPLKELEQKVQRKIPAISPELEFASGVIGKIVIESARYSNKLTYDGETKYKELVNLILGRAEVAKAEILAVTKEDTGWEEKQAKMLAVKNDAVEYFESVMAQRQ